MKVDPQLFYKRHGEFHGMCSEICGVLHGFMLIQGVACSVAAWVGLLSIFISWLTKS